MTSVKTLIDAISSVSLATRIIAFAIAAIITLVTLAADKQRRSLGGKVVISIAIIIAILAILSQIIASAPGPGGVYHLRVIVLDPHKIPVQKATLRSATFSDIATDEQGIANIAIPSQTLSKDRTVKIFADKDAEGLHGTKTVILSDDYNPQAEIHLEHIIDATITGMIEDRHRRAISGAAITVVDGKTTYSNDQGTFTVDTNAATGEMVRLHIEKTGFRPVDQMQPAGRDSATIVLKHSHE